MRANRIPRLWGLSPTAFTNNAGFTLIEAVVSIALVGVVLVAAMRTVGASAKSQLITQRQARGMMLAQDLMAEVLAKDYEDPDETPLILGVELLETLGDRSDYDDIDDYHGYVDDPISDESGAAVSGFTGWKREVSVWVVEVTDLNTATAGLIDTGIKRVAVTVSYGSTPIVTLTTVRTEAHAGDYAGSTGLGG